jgi:hypothetical protein
MYMGLIVIGLISAVIAIVLYKFALYCDKHDYVVDSYTTHYYVAGYSCEKKVEIHSHYEAMCSICLIIGVLICPVLSVGTLIGGILV